MSRRDYPVADLYEERERDFYRSGRRGTRDYVELDEDIRTNRTPDFLREDYGRNPTAGPLVVRQHGHAHSDDRRTEVDVDTSRHARSTRGSPPRPRTREIEKEEIIIRENLPPRRREQSVILDEFSARRSVPDLRARPRKEEIDIDIRRDSDARSVRSARPREIERDEIDIDIRRRDDDTRSVRSRRPREEEIDIDIRHESDVRSVKSSRPPRNFEEEDITIRRSETLPERRPPPPRTSRGSDEEITIRRGEGSRPPPPRPREVEKTEIDITERRGPRSRRGDFESEEIDITRESRGRGSSRERITIRELSRPPPPRERSMPPPNLLRRETEEFVIRRRRPSPSPSPSPPPPPPQPRARAETQEIIIRRTEQRSPTPPPPPPPREPTPPPPPPVVQPIVKPPIYQEIHQEIITHHRHIDHGVERARSPSPSPPPPMREPTPPPPPPVEKFESLEIDIRRRDGGKGRDEEIEIIQTRGRERSRSPSVVSRARSLDMPRRHHHHYDDDLEQEAEYYNRKALERGFPGEGYNGATRDWALVDVPPGTEKVRMDGAGGGAQEITWQRYNGTRRSKFITGDREFDTQYGLPAPPAAPPVDDRRVGPVRNKPADMWTEVTKDLVLKEAIEHMGYEYEETDDFFYVMEYLKYDDVLQLVEISDDIRKARRRRIREIEWEREALSRPREEDSRYFEREIIIDRKERRH